MFYDKYLKDQTKLAQKRTRMHVLEAMILSP